jgi:hypothetical protein
MEAAPQSQLATQDRCLPGLRTFLPVVLALASGLALRLWMLKQFFSVDGDPLIYGEMAKNLILHGHYALTAAGGVMAPTLIRLPGYPLLLAACFKVFGMENYASAAWVQIALELAGCLLLLCGALPRLRLVWPRFGWQRFARSRHPIRWSQCPKRPPCLPSRWRCGPWRASTPGRHGRVRSGLPSL